MQLSPNTCGLSPVLRFQLTENCKCHQHDIRTSREESLNLDLSILFHSHEPDSCSQKPHQGMNIVCDCFQRTTS